MKFVRHAHEVEPLHLVDHIEATGADARVVPLCVKPHSPRSEFTPATSGRDLSDLLRVPREKPGARAIIVYPMNALVNDQVERIYRWLRGQDGITVFHFTSETPEDQRDADDAGVPVYEACRIRTRQQARRNPPDVLSTNYSMLEYTLCRPQDVVFSDARCRLRASSTPRLRRRDGRRRSGRSHAAE